MSMIPSQVKLEVGAQEGVEVVLAGAADVEEVVKYNHTRCFVGFGNQIVGIMTKTLTTLI